LTREGKPKKRAEKKEREAVSVTTSRGRSSMARNRKFRRAPFAEEKVKESSMGGKGRSFFTLITGPGLRQPCWGAGEVNDLRLA